MAINIKQLQPKYYGNNMNASIIPSPSFTLLNCSPTQDSHPISLVHIDHYLPSRNLNQIRIPKSLVNFQSKRAKPKVFQSCKKCDSHSLNNPQQELLTHQHSAIQQSQQKSIEKTLKKLHHSAIVKSLLEVKMSIKRSQTENSYDHHGRIKLTSIERSALNCQVNSSFKLRKLDPRNSQKKILSSSISHYCLTAAIQSSHSPKLEKQKVMAQRFASEQKSIGEGRSLSQQKQIGEGRSLSQQKQIGEGGSGEVGSKSVKQSYYRSDKLTKQSEYESKKFHHIKIIPLFIQFSREKVQREEKFLIRSLKKRVYSQHKVDQPPF